MNIFKLISKYSQMDCQTRSCFHHRGIHHLRLSYQGGGKLAGTELWTTTDVITVTKALTFLLGVPSQPFFVILGDPQALHL